MNRTLSLILVIPLLFVCQALSAKPVVRIAVGEWPPYLAHELPHYGVAAHIVEKAFALSNVEVEYGFFPWSRAALYVDNGRWDASILWVKTEERAKHYLFSDVVFDGTAVFFHRKETSFNWKTFKDLQGLRFGGLMSASYPWFQAAKAEGIPLYMETVTSEHLNIAKLLSKRIDAFSLDKLVGLYLLQKEFPIEGKRISYHPQPIESWPYRLIFTDSPQGSTFVKAFNQGLKKLKDSGQVQQLLDDAAKGVYLRP